MVSYEAKEITELKNVQSVWGFVSLANMVLFFTGIFTHQIIYSIIAIPILIITGSVTRNIKEELSKLTDLEK